MILTLSSRLFDSAEIRLLLVMMNFMPTIAVLDEPMITVGRSGTGRHMMRPVSVLLDAEPTR